MVSLLDHNDLVCPDGHGVLTPRSVFRYSKADRTIRTTRVYGCGECEWFITQIEFLRNSHGTRESRRARIANREIGRAA